MSYALPAVASREGGSRELGVGERRMSNFELRMSNWILTTNY